MLFLYTHLVDLILVYTYFIVNIIKALFLPVPFLAIFNGRRCVPGVIVHFDLCCWFAEVSAGSLALSAAVPCFFTSLSLILKDYHSK